MRNRGSIKAAGETEGIFAEQLAVNNCSAEKKVGQEADEIDIESKPL